MASLTKDDIKGDMIIKNRRKTDVQSVIPILDVAREILEKYNYKLPILSNQKYNCYLKELGDICDIEQELHTHLARHTMATICINNGIDVNVIAKILGHSTIKTTLTIYAQFLTETVSKEKDKLNDIFK
jgi:integrase